MNRAWLPAAMTANRGTRLILPAMVLALVIVALFSPADGTEMNGDPRVSSFLAGPFGAKGLHDVAKRLGWRTGRRITPGFDSLSGGTIIAVLAPPQDLSERETGLLLRRVRDGASLLTIVADNGPLADSLGLKSAGNYVKLPATLSSGIRCPAGETRSVFQFMGKQAYVTPFAQRTRLPSRAHVFVLAQNPGDKKIVQTAAVGFPLGKGRVVAVSDENIFRNDFIRVCKWAIGVSVVQMLEYLSAGRRPSETRLVFDEYHQGFGPQPSVTRAIGRALFKTAPGLMLAQVIAASAVLLLAVAPRPIPPTAARRIERRSPFEHVEALSTAYSQIGATRVVADRLVRGLRRRLSGGTVAAPRPDDTDLNFLDKVAATHPQLAAEVELLRSALTRQSSPSQLLAVGEAIETIERTITS